MEERRGEAFAGDAHLTVIGKQLHVGDPAPDFRLEYLDLVDQEVRTISLADSAKLVRLLNVVNSLERPVCQRVTRRWEVLCAALPPDACIYTVSMDSPQLQANFQDSAGVLHQALSAHLEEQFGQDYGVWLKEWREHFVMHEPPIVIGMQEVEAILVADKRMCSLAHLVRRQVSEMEGASHVIRFDGRYPTDYSWNHDDILQRCYHVLGNGRNRRRFGPGGNDPLDHWKPADRTGAGSEERGQGTGRSVSAGGYLAPAVIPSGEEEAGKQQDTAVSSRSLPASSSLRWIGMLN